MAASIAIDRLEVDVNGYTFSARAAGPLDGRPVVLLHGFPQTSWCWRHQLTRLAREGYRAFAPDQRGYSAGARPKKVADYAMKNLLADVLALARATKMEQFDLVGLADGDEGGLRHARRLVQLTAPTPAQRLWSSPKTTES